MSSDKLTVYDASNQARIRIGAWKDMVSELIEYRELVGRLVKRNVTAQFRQSFLGYLWIVLPPIATVVVFSLLRMANIVNVPVDSIPGGLPYPLFALVGVTIWTFFTQLVMSGTGSITAGGALVSRIYFPREILVVSAAGGVCVNLLIRMLVVGISFAFFLYIPSPMTVAVILILIPLMALGLGLALFLAPVSTVMHDTSRILDFAFQFGMFLAPTVYPTPSLQDAVGGSSWQAGLYWLHSLNPVTHYIHAINDLISEGSVHWDAGLILSVGFSFLILATGWRFFHICEPLIAERM